MPSPNFERAINDLDNVRAPGAFQDARAAILNEIRDVTARNPQINAQMIVHKINEVENSPGHGHHDVQLVRGANGYLDVAPLQGYGQGYGQPGEYPQPAPPPGYQGGYPPGAYAPQPPVVYEQQNPVAPLVTGIVAGAVLSSLFRHRR